VRTNDERNRLGKACCSRPNAGAQNRLLTQRVEKGGHEKTQETKLNLRDDRRKPWDRRGGQEDYGFEACTKQNPVKLTELGTVRAAGVFNTQKGSGEVFKVCGVKCIRPASKPGITCMNALVRNLVAEKKEALDSG